jgi:hypothetical protein
MAKIGAQLKRGLKNILGRATKDIADRIDTKKLLKGDFAAAIGGGFGGGQKDTKKANESNAIQGGIVSSEGKKAGSFSSQNDKKYLCKYQVKTFIIMNGGETIDIGATNILSIEYLNDYEFNIMPLLKVSLQIDIRKKMWILKNKQNVRVKFELDKIGMEVEGEKFNTSPENIWNDEFSIYLNDNDESFDVTSMENRVNLSEGKENQGGKIDQENYFETQNIMDIFLMHPDAMSASRYVINKVYTEGTLQNIVAHMLTESRHKKVLMSKSENDESYREIIIPPLPLYKALIYLDQYFGIYKKGAIIYYDVNTLYILNSAGTDLPYRENEWKETTFLVAEINKATPGNGMVLREGEQISYPSVSEMDANSQNFAIAKNAELGSSAKIVVTDTTDVEIHNADQSYLNERNENITFIKDKNKFTGDVMKARMEENECIFYFNGENLDISAFTPNKIYHTIFEETSKQQSYGGNTYRIAYAYHYLKPESNEYMTSSHRLILKKNGGASDRTRGLENLFSGLLDGFDITDPLGSLGKVFGNIQGIVKGEIGKFEDRINNFIADKVNSFTEKATGSANELLQKFAAKLDGKLGNINIGGYAGKIFGGDIKDFKLSGGFGGLLKKKEGAIGNKIKGYIDKKIGNKLTSSVSSIVDRYKSKILGR